MKPQPMIAVRDVKATSAWYQRVLGFTSGHGGTEYEQLLFDREMVGLPVFMEIDFVGKTASTTRQHVVERTSKIDTVEHLPNNRMSVQGADDEYGWSMMISEETGSMTLAVAGEAVGFIVLGACTIR